MNAISILLSLISALIIVFVIVFEGKLKVENRDKITLKDFRKELGKISLFGWILVALMLFLDAGNNVISIIDNQNKNNQYVKDTIRLTSIIETLNQKSHNDSITINKLEKLVKNNGLKSDSIKLQVVDNAVEAMKKQNELIEKERENIFAHFQSEVEDNLKKIMLNFEKKRINGFADTSIFIGTRLSNEFIKKYENISTNKIIIEHLIETSESINTVNKYADLVSSSQSKSDTRKLNIRMLIKNLENTENYLILIYGRINGIESYKEYELNRFNEPNPKINRDSLKMIFNIDYIIKTDKRLN